MDDKVIWTGSETVGGRHECRRAVSCVPMFDRALKGGAQRDEGALLVAATWLWTRFDLLANADLVQILSENNVFLRDPEDLKQVDAILRLASYHLFDDLYEWCLKSSYVIVDDVCLPSPVIEEPIRGPFCHRRDVLQSIG